MQRNKNIFTPYESAIITDRSFLPLKEQVIEKVMQLLSSQRKTINTELSQCFESFNDLKPSLISLSKGDHYMGLPYAVLDFPKYLSREKSFAVRTIFLWGSGWSVQFLISGEFKKSLQEKLIENFKTAEYDDWYYCVNQSAFRHHFSAENYLSLPELKKGKWEDKLIKKGFLKIGKPFGLMNDETALNSALTQTYKRLNAAINN